jgi:hypothetical protein
LSEFAARKSSHALLKSCSDSFFSLTLELVVPSSKNNRFGLGGGDVSDELETFSLIRSSHFMVALLRLSHSGHLCLVYHYLASLSLSLSN